MFVTLEKLMDGSDGMSVLHVELSLLHVLLSLVFAWIALGILVKILCVMENGSPFGGEVSGALMKLAWIVLGFGIGSVILENIVQVVWYKAVSAAADVEISAYFARSETDFGFLGVFALVLLLSYVFRCGEELQKRDDETL